MSFTTNTKGRLANQIFRNLCVSDIAEKNNLYVNYSSYKRITNLGFRLFSGIEKYNNTIVLNDDNFFEMKSKINLINSNIDANENYFQTKEISNYLYKKVQDMKETIMSYNHYSYNNNDCFIHVRLGDVPNKNPGFEYYSKVIKMLKYDKLYIASDSPRHPIVQNLLNSYNGIFVNLDEVNTIKFGSSKRHIILSGGSYSAIIGYLAFFSTIYYPDDKYMFNGDIFSIPGWNKIL